MTTISCCAETSITLTEQHSGFWDRDIIKEFGISWKKNYHSALNNSSIQISDNEESYETPDLWDKYFCNISGCYKIHGETHAEILLCVTHPHQKCCVEIELNQEEIVEQANYTKYHYHIFFK